MTRSQLCEKTPVLNYQAYTWCDYIIIFFILAMNNDALSRVGQAALGSCNEIMRHILHATPAYCPHLLVRNYKLVAK